jgi:cytochrome c biogenesis protein CcmG/thiol:disulfide interchange protein DsbE
MNRWSSYLRWASLLTVASSGSPLMEAQTLAQAGPGPLQSGAPPFARRQEGDPQGWNAEIEAFLKKLLATYQNATSYRDRGRVKLTQQMGRVKTTTEMPMELTFQRPNLLFLDAGQYTVVSDAKVLFFVVPSLNQFTAAKAPEKIEKKHLQAGSVMGGADEGHPDLVDFLVQPEAYRVLLGQISKISWKPEATVEGQPCRVLFYETVLKTKITTFVETNRMLILKVEAETSSNLPTAGPSAMPATPPQPPSLVSYELWPVELNTDLGSNAFRFKLPPGCQRVAQIGAGTEPGREFAPPGREPGEAAEGGHLVGHPAPPVSGTDLAGKPLAAADLRGKVVLLFFWSLDGGEHTLLSIPIVQQLADQFKDRPEVLVLGVSGDEDKTPVVSQLLERKKARFRNVIDEGMKLRTDFQLGGVPTFVLIGADGTVRWAKLGAPPTLREELAAKLREALKPADH